VLAAVSAKPLNWTVALAAVMIVTAAWLGTRVR